MADNANGKDLAALLMDLMKEQTMAMIELRKSIDALRAAMVGTDEDDGLFDQFSELQSSVDSLDTHVIGQNVLLSRYSFAFDRLMEVEAGDADAQPPVAPRKPTFDDFVAALKQFDKKVEEEAAQEKEEERDEAAADAAADQPPKPAMMSNTPPKPSMARSLPPPVMPASK